MSELSVDVLKNILENIPGDYTIEFNKDDITYLLQDKVEIDVENMKLILKS